MAQAHPHKLYAGNPVQSPFSLDSEQLYREWRNAKLAQLPAASDELLVGIDNPREVSEAESRAAHRALARCGFVIYRLAAASEAGKGDIAALGRHFGLSRLDNNLCADEDSITSLQVVAERGSGEYIPYTNKRLNWHTDGYYNSPSEQIRGVLLHCARPAREGGESALMDHELAYIALRDENPEFIRALMHPRALSIPANIQDGREIRPLQSGPVFSVDDKGHLHMRYSARGRNVIWRDDATTSEAAQCLLNLFQDGSPYIFRHRLEAGEGVLSHNVLHCRTAFDDDPRPGYTRLLYRARYFDRIADPMDKTYALSE